MRPSLRFTALVGGVVAVFSACDCSRRPVTQQSVAEVAVVWIDETGAQFADRDATYDFGQAFMGERVGRKLVVRNLGKGPLTLTWLEVAEGAPTSIGTEVAADAAFDVRFVPEQTIGALEEAELDMFYTPPHSKDPSVTSAVHQVKLLLTTGNTPPDESTAFITLKGRAGAGVCQLPAALDFGRVPTQEKFPLTLELKNPTGVSVNAFVGEPTSTSGDHLAFAIAQGSPKGAIALAPGQTARVVFEFSPTEQRPYAAAVKVRASEACPESEVKLLGEGADEVLSWSPTSIDFGYVSPGSPAPREVTFTNNGKVPLRITQITSSLPSDFGVIAAPGTVPSELVVPGGVPTKLVVACSPAGLGPRQAQLTFNTGMQRQPKGTIDLRCFGGGPNIQVSPRPVLAFGRVGYFANANPPLSVFRKVTVMNVGTKPPNNDPNGNLRLGTVGAGGPGQPPLFALTPLNATTAQGEFSLSAPPAYDPAVGLEATAGKNLLELMVTLTPQSVGTKEAELTIFSNDADEPAVKVRITADAQAVPPCNLEVTPAQLNFGLVTPPQYKDLPVTLTNLGQSPGDVCLISGIELAPGSDLAYSLPQGPVAAAELQPRQSMQVVVRVWPKGQVPTGLQTLTGALGLSLSNPSRPQASVPLTATVGSVCLTVAPNTLDFGSVKQNCNSSTRTFTVYNTCAQAITLTGFSMQAAAGQPAGGPDCPGAQSCPEFFLVSTPPIPTGGIPLSPGATPVTFQAKYRPIDIGTDTGAVAISALQGGQAATYLVTLQGKGDTVGQQTDTFLQAAKPKADILMVVDDSCSMSDKQTSLGNNFASFIAYAVAANVDYQIGVTTTDDDPAQIDPIFGTVIKPDGSHGRLVAAGTNPKILSSTTPQVELKFKQNVNVGTNGSGIERPLQCAYKALTPPTITSDNAGLLRTDANLAIVTITDAPDQSAQPATYYLNQFLNVKGFNRANMFSFNVIGPFLPTSPGPNASCQYDGTPDDGKLASLATQTNGVKEEICNQNWSTALQGLGKTAFGFRTTFFLNSTPDTTGGKVIEVKLDGQVVPATQGGRTVWRYDAASNSIVFDPTQAPSPGQTLTITYSVACL